MRLDEDSRVPERRAALSPGPVPLMQPQPAQVGSDKEGNPLRLRASHTS